MSQRDRLLQHLRAGKHITPIKALNRFNCFRLSGRILELREAGYRIKTQMVRLSSGKRVASYHMS